MSRGRLVALALGLVGLGALVIFTLRPPGAPGSSLSRGPDGLLAARAYLEARGSPVELIDRAEPPAGGGVVVEALPWQRPAPGRAGFLRAHLAAGGDLVLLYSGGFDPAEHELFEELGIEVVPTGGGALAGLAPAGELRLAPVAVPGAPGPPALAVPRTGWRPRPPEGSRPLYRAPDGEVAVFIRHRGGGRTVVAPAAAFANAALQRGGNADLLETLRGALGDRWRFDEYVHGLTAPATAGAALPRRVIELVGAHLGVLYLLALLAVARRFGPAWREPPVVAGSTAAFLLGLGALHHRMGHHAEAAALLVERVGALDGRPVSGELAARAEGAGAAGLVSLARTLARRPASRGIRRRRAAAPAGAGGEESG